MSMQMCSTALKGEQGVSELAIALQDRNACASFECITSFNGDHGYVHIYIYLNKVVLKLHTAC
jgi:hypothetical protein